MALVPSQIPKITPASPFYGMEGAKPWVTDKKGSALGNLKLSVSATMGKGYPQYRIQEIRIVDI